MTPRFAKGLSLIEVLVSLLILTIGLIGIFNLHIVAKRSSYESLQQSQAAYAATDILNRMRLNVSQLANYEGTYTGALTTPTLNCEDNTAALCTPEQLRLWDLFQWESQIFGALETENGRNIGGLDRPTACIDVDNDGAVTVVLAWYGSRALLGQTPTDNSDIIQTCGGNHDKRRIFFLQSVII